MPKEPTKIKQLVNLSKGKHDEKKDPLTWINEKWLEFLHNLNFLSMELSYAYCISVNSFSLKNGDFICMRKYEYFFTQVNLAYMIFFNKTHCIILIRC